MRTVAGRDRAVSWQPCSQQAIEVVGPQLEIDQCGRRVGAEVDIGIANALSVGLCKVRDEAELSRTEVPRRPRQQLDLAIEVLVEIDWRVRGHDVPRSCKAKAGLSEAKRTRSRNLLPEAGVDLLERRRARAQLLLGQRVERRLHGVEMGMQVLGIAVDVEEPGHDLALGGMLLQEGHGAD